MRKLFLTTCALLCCLFANAESMNVKKLKYAGPYIVQKPYMVDQTDVNARPFDPKSLLESYLSFSVLENAPMEDDVKLQGNIYHHTLHMLGFALENSRYAKGEIKVKGAENYVIYIDGKKQQGGSFAFEPATHQVTIKVLAAPGEELAPEVTIETQQEELLAIREDGLRNYTLADVLHGTRFGGVSLSPSGKYLITNYNTTMQGGKTNRKTTVTELATGKAMGAKGEGIRWMPKTDKYWYISTDAQGRDIITVDPATGAETVWANNIPDGHFQISPAEDYLLYSIEQKGPAEKEEIYEVIEPDDRQPGWRNRSYLAKYDFETALLNRVTFGYKNIWVTDISADGTKALVMIGSNRLTKRPTSLSTLAVLDMVTLQMDTLVAEDGFMNSAKFSPCGTQVAITGSPEALGGVGLNVKEGQTPNMYDYQLYIMSIADKKVTPVTKEFNPNVESFRWSPYDGKIYFTAENKDCKSLYRLDPVKGKIEQLPTQEDLVNNFTMAQNAPVMVWYGQGASNSDRAYVVDLKKGKSSLLEDLSKDILNGVKLGECVAWNFVNSKGDTINGRYYLPPHFDPAKKYPLIVNYYGGCSPTSRNFESRYPHHLYAAMGYVVYVVNPSGATGFGQEFAARHVNTAGNGPADDIVEGTKQFCKEHSFVNSGKIGCIGASYGGFTTQYLQTITDIFAAAISHAGISDHTSYWGEGYWGYSYSEVSMANSYPWSHTDLYVKQSPLYNAHKVNTPILFLHGDKDNNVPVGESIQMYTALKLLGKETAMVLVKDQDHHILDYGKRIQWQNTIFAWFAKWLQDDPMWWEQMYAPKTL